MNKKLLAVTLSVGLVVIIVGYLLFLQPYTFASSELGMKLSVPRGWNVTKIDQYVDETLWMQSIASGDIDKLISESNEKEVLLYHGDDGVGRDGDKGFYVCVTRKDAYTAPSTVESYLNYIKAEIMNRDTYFNGSQFQRFKQFKIGNRQLLSMDMKITQCNVVKDYKISAYEEGDYYVGIYAYVEHEEDWPAVDNVINAWQLGE